MLRAILAVFVGYIVMAVVVVACFTGMQLGFGTEKVFKPGSYMASDLFIIAALGVTLVAAMLGGAACAAVARTPMPVRVLAGLVVVLGLFSALANASKPDPGPRTGDITPFEAAQKARQPDWYAFTIPFLGAAGALAGAALVRRKRV